MTDEWASQDWQARADTGRDLGGRHLRTPLTGVARLPQKVPFAQSPEQYALDRQIGFLEDMVTDLADQVGMCDKTDLDQSVWRLIDRLRAIPPRIVTAELELRALAP